MIYPRTMKSGKEPDCYNMGLSQCQPCFIRIQQTGLGLKLSIHFRWRLKFSYIFGGNKIIYVGVYFSRAPGQVPQGQPWSRTRISWAGRREIKGINSNSWPQEPTMGIIWTHTDISMSSHKNGTELSCSNSSKREFLPGNPRLQRPWSSSHWTGLFQANLLLDSLAN